jgi:hypothetical protein
VLPPDAVRTEWIFATVGQSEWCPAGNVRVDLTTGHYVLTSRAPRGVCNDPGLQRSTHEGTLNANKIALIREAYRRVLKERLQDSACDAGGRPTQIVIDNGGPHILIVSTGAMTVAAPSNLSCWTNAAFGLHDLLAHTFAPEDYGEEPLK